jgi:hypothetical protein
LKAINNYIKVPNRYVEKERGEWKRLYKMVDSDPRCGDFIQSIKTYSRLKEMTRFKKLTSKDYSSHEALHSDYPWTLDGDPQVCTNKRTFWMPTSEGLHGIDFLAYDEWKKVFVRASCFVPKGHLIVFNGIHGGIDDFNASRINFGGDSNDSWCSQVLQADIGEDTKSSEGISDVSQTQLGEATQPSEKSKYLSTKLTMLDDESKKNLKTILLTMVPTVKQLRKVFRTVAVNAPENHNNYSDPDVVMVNTIIRQVR